MLGNSRGHHVYKYLLFIKRYFSKRCSTAHSLTSGILLKISSLLQPMFSLEYCRCCKIQQEFSKVERFPEGMPIYKRGEEVRRIKHKSSRLR